ncbi:hypothetical protein TWF718_008815 [Orbilia javanica]|uniref:F-box domain-containing protein n=1 Tax=Orbilia javanica TaxID=47235 RepID=A0AAN8RB62_9PEZI
MPSLSSLPPELLIHILSSPGITITDIITCSKTCKLLNTITSQCKINYTFKVDHPSQSTWKLAKHLLSTPETGERFHSITVTWHRRKPRKPKTWARRWEWTKGEKVKIAKICKKWKITDVIDHICDGWNSESLVPFLLCFTPRLKSLDYGEVVLDMIYPSPTAREGIRISEYGEGSSYHWEPRDKYDDGWPYFDCCWESIDLRTSWFYSALNQNSLLPGLSSLTNFSHRGWVEDGHWPGVYLSKVMLLPRLESVSLRRCYPTSAVRLKPPADKELKSPIKRLELIKCGFDQRELEYLARFTGSLRSFTWAPRGTLDREQIGNLFLQHNAELVRDRMVTELAEEAYESSDEPESDSGEDYESSNSGFSSSDEEEDEEEVEEDEEEVEEDEDEDEEDGYGHVEIDNPFRTI